MADKPCELTNLDPMPEPEKRACPLSWAVMMRPRGNSKGLLAAGGDGSVQIEQFPMYANCVGEACAWFRRSDCVIVHAADALIEIAAMQNAALERGGT